MSEVNPHIQKLLSGINNIRDDIDDNAELGNVLFQLLSSGNNEKERYMYEINLCINSLSDAHMSMKTFWSDTNRQQVVIQRVASELRLVLDDNVLQNIMGHMMLQVHTSFHELLPGFGEKSYTLFGADMFSNLISMFKMATSIHEKKSTIYLPDTVLYKGFASKICWQLSLDAKNIRFIPLTLYNDDTKDITKELNVLCMDSFALDEAINSDIENDLMPCVVVCVLGGQRLRNDILLNEDLKTIQDICHHYNIWMHCDIRTSAFIMGGMISMEQDTYADELVPDVTPMQILPDFFHSVCDSANSILLYPGEIFSLSGPLTILLCSKSSIEKQSLPPSSPIDNCRFEHLFQLWYWLLVRFSNNRIASVTKLKVRKDASKRIGNVENRLTTYDYLHNKFQCLLNLYLALVNSMNNNNIERSNISFIHSPMLSIDILVSQTLFFTIKPEESLVITLKAIGATKNQFILSLYTLLDTEYNTMKKQRSQHALEWSEADEFRYSIATFIHKSLFPSFFGKILGFKYRFGVQHLEPGLGKSVISYIRKMAERMAAHCHLIQKLRPLFERSIKILKNFEVVPIEALKNDIYLIGLGAFRFTPAEIPASFYSDLAPLLKNSLIDKVQREFHCLPIQNKWIQNQKSSSTLLCCVTLPIFSIRTEDDVRNLVSRIAVCASALPLPDYIQHELELSIQDGIKQAQLRLEQEEYNNENGGLINYIPVVGPVWNWLVGTEENDKNQNNITLHGHTFDIRSKNLRSSKDAFVIHDLDNKLKLMSTDNDIPPAVSILNENLINNNHQKNDKLKEETASDPNVAILLDGIQFQSHNINNDGKQQTEVIILSFDMNNGKLMWRQKKNLFSFSFTQEQWQSMELHSLTDIWIGKRTPVLLNPIFSSIQSSLCFSLVGINKSLHLEASHKDEIRICVNAVKKLLVSFGKTFVWDSKISSEDRKGIENNDAFKNKNHTNTNNNNNSQGNGLESLNLLNALKKGMVFTSYYSDISKNIHKRQILLSFDESKNGFIWHTDDKEYIMLLEELCDIYLGKQTDILRSEIADNAPTESCFSMKSLHNHLHLQANDANEVKVFLQGLRQVLSDYQTKKKSSSDDDDDNNNTSISVSENKEDNNHEIAPLIIDPSKVKLLPYCGEILRKGIPFRVYTFHKDDMTKAVAHDVVLFYRHPEESDPTSQEGLLCWSMVGTPLKYSPSRCIKMDRTVQVCVGKQTRVFQLTSAADAKTDCCCSILVNKMILNIEAPSNVLRQVFLNGFHYLMTNANKMQLYTNDDDITSSTN